MIGHGSPGPTLRRARPHGQGRHRSDGSATTTRNLVERWFFHRRRGTLACLFDQFAQIFQADPVAIEQQEENRVAKEFAQLRFAMNVAHLAFPYSIAS